MLTKISVFAKDTRLQLENKKLAITRLKGKLQSFELQKREQQLQDTWFPQLQRGNPVKTFEGKDFKKTKQANLSKRKEWT